MHKFLRSCKHTIRQFLKTFESDFELKRICESGRVIEDSDLDDIDKCHLSDCQRNLTQIFSKSHSNFTRFLACGGLGVEADVVTAPVCDTFYPLQRTKLAIFDMFHTPYKVTISTLCVMQMRFEK